MQYFFGLEIHQLQALWRVVPRVVDQRRDRVKRQKVCRLQQFKGLRRLHFTKVKPPSHVGLSIQNGRHPRASPQGPFRIRNAPKRPVQGEEHAGSTLPIVDVLKVWGGIDCDNSVGIYRLFAPRRLPAVKQSSDGQQSPPGPLIRFTFLAIFTTEHNMVLILNIMYMAVI